MQAHPLNKAFGQQLALQTPPVMHARAFKKSIERAVQAGDANLSTGAASYQVLCSRTSSETFRFRFTIYGLGLGI
jgi:hypothetical protein